MNKSVSWQLQMFEKTLKKKLRLQHLKNHIKSLNPSDRCILITCGDNNGAMNYHLRSLGGNWSWADLEEKSIAEMEHLLGDEVSHVTAKLPYEDGAFDLVIAIDVHEHLDNPIIFTKEIHRITRPGGKIIITVPNGDETKIATRIKNAVGMTKERYGHVREGYDIPELKEIMRKCNIEPVTESSFSGFFTEMLELFINFLYVVVLAKKSKAKVETGTIAPSTKDQLKSVKNTYHAYSLIYPFFFLISKLDFLVAFTRGYAVMVQGRKYK